MKMRNQAIDAMSSLIKVVSRSLNIPASALLEAIREKLDHEDARPMAPALPPISRRRGAALFNADWILNGIDAWKRFIEENHIQEKVLDPSGNYIVYFLNKTDMIPEVEPGAFSPRYEIEFNVREDRSIDLTYRPAKFEHKGGLAFVTQRELRPFKCPVHNVVYGEGETCGICDDFRTVKPVIEHCPISGPIINDGLYEKVVTDRIATPPAPIPVAGTCRACGCTDADCSDCIRLTGAPCSWAEPDLCSACQTLMNPEPKKD